MDAPAMLTTKHVPQDVGQRTIAAEEEGGQQQMHRDEKPHKPVLRKMKDKVKKIKNTIAGHGHGRGNGDEHEHENDTGGSNSSGMDEEDAAMREAEVEKGGYQEDVEDKRVMESSPELHGTPMYDSERIPVYDALGGPAAAKEVERNDATGMRPGDLGGPAASKEVERNDALGGPAAAKEVERNDATGMRPGDLGGPAASKEVERNDALGGPAAAKEVERNDATGMRAGDLGGPAASKEVERNDALGGPAAAKEVERNDATGMRAGDLGGPAASKEVERNDALGGPAAAKEVERNDATGMRPGDLGGPAASKEVERNDALGGPAAAKEVERNDATGMRPGDLGGPAASKEVERNDALGGPAAAKEVERNDATGMRPGDLGGPAASKEVERNDALGGPAAAKEVERNDAPGVRPGDLGGPAVEGPAAPHSKTPTPRGGEDIGTTDVVREFEAMTVSDDPKQAGAGKMDRDQVKETEAMPVSDGTGEEWTDAPTDAGYTGTYTDMLKNTAAGTTEYGKKLASTVYEKVAGVGTVVASKAQQVTPGFGSGGNAQDDSSATPTAEPMAVDAGKRDVDLPKQGTPAASSAGTEELKNAVTDATTGGAPGATYTDKIRSAAAGTTEYGKQLANTVYEKVAGVGTAVAGKAQQVMPSAGTATPGVGAQDGSTAPTVNPGAGGPGNGQDKGVYGVTAYIAEKLRPGDEERSLSEAITGAVQQRKEGVGSTVAKAREVPAQAVTRAREAVTSLTGGNRVSETVQPTTEGNIGEGVAAEVPTLRGEEIGAARTNNTNGM